MYLGVLSKTHGEESEGKLHHVEEGDGSERSGSVQSIAQFNVCEENQNRLDDWRGH